MKPELIERGVHRDRQEYGFYRRDAASDYQGSARDFEPLHVLAQASNAAGRVPKDAPKQITVFDVSKTTASAKLVAHWGIDYFHLVTDDDGWKI